jgi:hypothetical protein
LISLRDAGSGRRWHLNIPGMTGLSFNATNQREHVLHINQFGRIGINTNQPAVALDVNALNNDNLAIFTSSAPIANIKATNGTVANRFGYDNVGGIIGTSSNHGLSFQTNGQRQITLKVNGYLGIGTFSPDYKLHVVGVGKFDDGIILKNEGGESEVLDYYESINYATGIGFGNTNFVNSYSYKATRVGNLVTICLPQEILNLNATGAVELQLTTALPPRFRPNTQAVRQPIQVMVNGSSNTGFILVKTDGNIVLRPSISNPLVLWSGNGNSGFFACCISYIL